MSTKNKDNLTQLVPPKENITPLQRPPIVRVPIRQPSTPTTIPTVPQNQNNN